MSQLPPRPDLNRLRHQAKDLLRAARDGEPNALSRIHDVSDRLILASAQLALARGYGFASWARLKTEVTRRDILDRRDLDGLAVLLGEEPGLAVAGMEHWRDHPLGAAPLNFVAMIRCDNAEGIWKDVAGTGPIAELLIANGAPVDGNPGESETPLITAASYGDAEVARVLIEAGAELEATASPDAGGVPNGTALLHAAVFGNTEVLDVLVAAGASVDDPVLAAAAGDITRHDVGALDEDGRIRAMVMAADHQRLDVIDQLVAAPTPVDGVDATWFRHPLRVAAENGRPASVRRLLAHGANPNLTDPEGLTPLDLCCKGQTSYPGHRGHAEVEAILAPLTRR